MAGARRLVALGRAARTDAKMKVRQPLRRALVLHPGVALDDELQAEVAVGAERPGARGRRHAVGPDVVDGGARTSGPSGPGSARRSTR